jgi:hypothetical protein
MTTVLHQRDRGKLPTDQVVWIDRMSKWGNPFSHLRRSRASIQVRTRAEAIEHFRAWWYLPGQEQLRAEALVELKDKVLLCWCKPLGCHGDVIAEFVNNYYASAA